MAKKRVNLIEATDDSLDTRMAAVRAAVTKAYNDGPGEYSYVEVVFGDHVIVNKGGKLWSVDYTVDSEGTVTLTSDPVMVKVTYTPVKEGVVFGLLSDYDQGEQTQEGEGDGEPKSPTGRRWGVLIIQEGMSKNRNRYARKVLKEAAPLYEGAHIFMDHQEEVRRFGRSTKDLAGFLKNVQGVLLSNQEADGGGTFALAATAVVTKAWVRREMLDAFQEGFTNLFGLSHDVQAESKTVMGEDGAYYDVEKIDKVSSVDFVTNPAAGGRVLRLVASDSTPHTLEGDGRMLQKMIEAIKASGNQGLIAQLDALGKTPNEDQVLGIYSEAIKTQPTKEGKETKADPPTPTTPKAVKEAAPAPVLTGITEAQFMEVRRDGLNMFVENTLSGTSLHGPVKEQLQKRLRKQIDEATGPATLPTKDAILDAVKEQVDLFALLAEKNVVMPATSRPRAEIIKDTRQQVEAQIDEFFGIKQEPQTDGSVKVRIIAEGDRRPLSFRNVYIDVTGDRGVTGLIKEATRLTEALNSASFDQILGDSITRRMVAEYQLASQAQWRGTIADVVPVTDFRTQRRMRFGGYGNLTTVGEGNPYPAMTSPTDEEATYAPAKRGGTEQLTIEMIANDDVNSIRRIPQRLSRAAYQTLYEFVFDFMASNAVIYDAVALVAAGHNNDQTAALSNTTLSTARLQLAKQTDMSNGKRLGLPGRYLWVPSDLAELAYQLSASPKLLADSALASQGEPAALNYQNYLGWEPRVVDYWTDTDNWFFTSSIRETPMLEIGFWGGEDPQLFVQDLPNVGSLFSNDAITYKMRHVYGGAVLDFRGFTGSIV